MPLKLTLKDGSLVESDSVRELLEFYKQVSNGHSSKAVIQNRIKSAESADLTEAAGRLVHLLLSKPDGMETNEIAKTFGVSPKGVGGTVTAVARWGKKHGLSKKQIIRKTRGPNANGKTVRTLSLTESFRKMVKEGKVPVKLDT